MGRRRELRIATRLPETTMDIEGKIVGNYVLQRLLGQGGMGAVYLARHAEIGHEVAIKMVSAHLAHKPNIANRFIAEAKALARIKHPNIITIFDFGRTDEGALYYVMERLEGEDFASFLKKEVPLSVEGCLRVMEQLCAGLHAAHASGVVHRDLKPGNIFVTSEDPLQLKILDFGIAKDLMRAEADNVSLTATGAVLGTPMMLAPEQAMGRTLEIGPQVDIYALGVLAYWMLSGKPPFWDEDRLVIIIKHVTEEATWLADVADVSDAVARVVHNCLVKDPAERYGRADLLIEDFAKAANLEVSRQIRRLIDKTSERAWSESGTFNLAQLSAGTTTADGGQTSIGDDAPSAALLAPTLLPSMSDGASAATPPGTASESAMPPRSLTDAQEQGLLGSSGLHGQTTLSGAGIVSNIPSVAVVPRTKGRVWVWATLVVAGVAALVLMGRDVLIDAPKPAEVAAVSAAVSPKPPANAERRKTLPLVVESNTPGAKPTSIPVVAAIAASDPRDIVERPTIRLDAEVSPPSAPLATRALTQAKKKKKKKKKKKSQVPTKKKAEAGSVASHRKVPASSASAAKPTERPVTPAAKNPPSVPSRAASTLKSDDKPGKVKLGVHPVAF